MKKIILSILLLAPAFAWAGDSPKTNTYRTIASELLKDCTGTDKAVAVAGFSYSDGRDSRDGGVVPDWIIVIASILVVIYFAWGIRIYTIRAIHPTMAMVNSTMLLFVVVVLKFIFKFSALHILWLAPICVIVAFLSRNVNSPVSVLGWVFARMCCVGLDQKEMAKNISRQKRFQELVKSGVKPDEARLLIIKEESEGNIGR